MNVEDMDRISILKRLNSGQNYDHYIDHLLNVYHSLNNRRMQLSYDIENDLMIMGGVLYFLLYRESQYLGILNTDNLDPFILKNFLEYKTVDIDVQGHIYNEIYEEDLDKFIEESKNIKRRYIDTMKNDIFPDNEKSFKFINKVLQNKPLKNTITIGENFGINCEIKSEGNLEIRPQITVKVGQEEDHIFEALIMINFDKPITNIYKLKCLDRAFVGENIVVSITQQIFPNERSWRLIDKKKPIFPQMRAIFDENVLALIKFKQGYYRSYIVYNILKSAYEKNIQHLLDIMLPTNNILYKKLFFFRSSTMKAVTPPDILSEANKLASCVNKRQKSHKIATPGDTLRFIEICLDTWIVYNNAINN